MGVRYNGKFGTQLSVRLIGGLLNRGFIVVPIFLKTRVKDHGESSSRLLERKI